MGENPRSRLIESNQVESRKSRTFADARPQEKSDAEISGPLAMATSLPSASSRFDLLVSAHREGAWSVHPLWFNGSLLEREECKAIARGATARFRLPAWGVRWRGIRRAADGAGSAAVHRCPEGGRAMKIGSRALNLSAQTIVVSSPNDF